MINHISPEDGCIGFSKEGQKKYSDNVGYCFFLCHPNMIYRKLHLRSSSFYEIILPDQPVKLFFDIDGPIPEFFCETIENLLINYDTENIKFIPPRIILSACTPQKSSFHIIYLTVVFPNMNHLLNFTRTVLFCLRTKFDDRVYTNFRQFRTHLSTKFSQNRPFIHYSNTLFSPPPPMSDHEVFLLTLIPYQQCDLPLITCTDTSWCPNISSRITSSTISPKLTISKNSPLPHVVREFLNHFPAATVHTVTSLIDSNPSKLSFSLTCFPCPYQLNHQIHIHKSNHPYLIYSPSYPPILSYLYVGCHKERREHESIESTKSYTGINHHHSVFSSCCKNSKRRTKCKTKLQIHLGYYEKPNQNLNTFINFYKFTGTSMKITKMNNGMNFVNSGIMQIRCSILSYYKHQ